MEDMRIRVMGDKAQKSHIRAIKDFAAFLGHSPDTATPEELRACQLCRRRHNLYYADLLITENGGKADEDSQT